MFLNCCHRRLSVHVRDDVRDDHNQPVYAIFTPATWQIFMARCTPRQQRRDVLVHELAHAFEHFLGRVDPADTEGRQNRVAMIEGSFNAALDDQQGEDTIHALFGDESDGAGSAGDRYAEGELSLSPDDDMADWPTSISCPSCHQRHSSGRVRNGQPAFDPQRNGFVLWRVMNCAECGKEFRWLQRCTWEGLPLPDVIVQPQVRRLAEV